MPEKTYQLTFLNQEGGLDSGQEYNDLPTALEAFKCFVEPKSAEVYNGITLTEYDWTMKRERIVAALAF